MSYKFAGILADAHVALFDNVENSSNSVSHFILAKTQKNTAWSTMIDCLQAQQYYPYPITWPMDCYVPVHMQLVQGARATA